MKIQTTISESAYKLACIIGPMKGYVWNESVFYYYTKNNNHTIETAFLEIIKKFPMKNYKFNFIKKENDIFYYEIDVNKKS
ncbi:hypothetical protein [uncultured Clostridium sp.]|uniref:hypothetical protein n=1 Tax=uncultured Clostridium sp. TaxID=59620 RepID=UPI00260BB85C|nr:hypothetical protein [uncultured Clostridium sp.]